jgi:hypothetical protein
MTELAVALLLAALIAPTSAPVAVGRPAPVSAEAAATTSRAYGAAKTERDVREAQPKDKRNDDVKPDVRVKAPALAQAPVTAK